MRKILAIALLVVGLTSTALGKAPEADAENFELGVLACLSGECAEWGNNTVEGLKLAAKQLNEKGGILGKKITLRIQDTKESTGGSTAVSAYRSLSSSHPIQYFVGPSWTPGGLALAPIVGRRENVIMTSASLGVADFNETAPNLFNTWPHDSYSTRKLAQFAFNSGYRRIAILSSTQPWEKTQGDTFEKAFKGLGGEIILKSEPVANNGDYKAIAARMKHLQPEAVFLSNFNQMATAAKELKRVNFQGARLCILMDDTRVKAADGALEGAIFASYPDAKETFANSFFQEYHEKPGVTADTAYDTLMIYARAIEQAKTFDVQSVKTRIAQSSFSGASGKLVFDSQGGVVKDPTLYEVKGESWVVLK